MVDPIKLSVDSALEVEGREDTPQLTVKGYSTQTEPLQTWQDQTGGTLAQIGAGGQLQIGGEPGTPEALIEAHQTVTLPSTQPKRGWWSVGQMVGSLSQTISDAITWIAHELQLSGEGDVSGLHTALRAGLRLEASGDVTQAEVRAGDFQAENRSGSTGAAVGQLTGVRGTIDNGIDAHLDKAVGVEAALFSDGDITEAAAFEVASPGNNGTIDTLIGLKVPDLDQGTDNYAIHTGKGPAHFGDVLEMEAVAEPDTPPQDVLRLYTKSDGKPYIKNWSGIEYDLSSGTGGGGSSAIITGTAGENLIQGQIVYLRPSDQKWYKVDTDDLTSLVSTERGVVKETINADATGSIQIGGLSDDFTNLTAGQDVWAGTSAGDYTQTKPSSSAGGGQVAIVRIGMAVSSTEVLLDTKSSVQYLKRESLSHDAMTTITHHNDPQGYTREAKAYISTSEAGTKLEDNGSTTQDEDVELQYAIYTYGADECAASGASASSTWGTGYDADKAVDNSSATIWISAANDVAGAWIKPADFGSAKTIKRLKLTARNGLTDQMVKDFRLQYYDAGWQDAESWTGEIGWGASEQRTFDVSGDYSSTQWRVYVDDNNGSSYNVVSIAEVEMMEISSTAADTKLAQSIQVTGSQTVGLIKLWLKKVGSPTGSLTVTIETDNSGDPSGTPVGNGMSNTVSASSLSASYDWIEFTFTTDPNLAGSTTYWLVLETTDSAEPDDYVVWGADGSNPSYSDGEMESYDGASWNIESKDACFEVYAPGTTYESPILCDHWASALAVMLVRYDDGSGSDAETRTTFKNKVGATIDVTCEVEVP